MAGETWLPQGNGLIAPVQAECVLITISESYAIMETLPEVEEMLSSIPEDAKHAFVTISPKEGGKALINVAHIVGFVDLTKQAA